MSEVTGRVYRSKFEEKEKIKFSQLLKISVSRPWIFLFREPIVLLFSIYVALVNGILYMSIAAFPIVYGELRGWSCGVVSLAFLGIVLGVIFAILYGIWDNRRYIKIAKIDVSVPVPPEIRLSPAMVGSFALPIGLFWFAWTNYPSVHFMVSISACVPLGFGMALIYVSSFNYLVDTYIIYAASALAANSVLRSLFAALFRKFFLYIVISHLVISSSIHPYNVPQSRHPLGGLRTCLSRAYMFTHAISFLEIRSSYSTCFKILIKSNQFYGSDFQISS